RAAGQAVGLLKVRLYRPLPVEALRAALAGVPEVLVLDRNYSPGHGGVLHQELRAALYGMEGAPVIRGLLAGVGGVNVSPERSAAVVQGAAGIHAGPGSGWVRATTCASSIWSKSRCSVPGTRPARAASRHCRCATCWPRWGRTRLRWCRRRA